MSEQEKEFNKLFAKNLVFQMEKTVCNKKN